MRCRASGVQLSFERSGVLRVGCSYKAKLESATPLLRDSWLKHENSISFQDLLNFFMLLF